MKFQMKQLVLLLAAGSLASLGLSIAPGVDDYQVREVTNGGTIKGTVIFEGTPPAPERVDVTTQEDVCHEDPIYSESLVVSDDGQVRWAVVAIKGIKEGKDFADPVKEEEKPALDQAGCVFHPHVVAIPAGEKLKLINSDGVLHNVHTWPKKNRSRNMAMPGVIKEMDITFRRPERVRVSCDIHPWMEAWIIVTEHPYYDVSDEKGAFELTDVPPGKYTLTLWHETLGDFEQDVSVTAGQDVEVTFRVSKDGSRQADG